MNVKQWHSRMHYRLDIVGVYMKQSIGEWFRLEMRVRSIHRILAMANSGIVECIRGWIRSDCIGRTDW